MEDERVADHLPLADAVAQELAERGRDRDDPLDTFLVRLRGPPDRRRPLPYTPAASAAYERAASDLEAALREAADVELTLAGGRRV